MKKYLQDDICNNPRLFRTWQEKLATEDERTIAQAWRLQCHSFRLVTRIRTAIYAGRVLYNSKKNYMEPETLPVWQYGLGFFQAGGTKLEKCLHKNQQPQRK